MAGHILWGHLQREMGGCFPMQVHFGFCFTRYSRTQRLPGLICLEMVLSMAQVMHHLLVVILIVISVVGDSAILHTACGYQLLYLRLCPPHFALPLFKLFKLSKNRV